MAGRLDSGAIVDDVITDEGMTITVRYERCPAGWQASFELGHPEAANLSVMHRLVTDTLSEAKSSVPAAISFLLGTPVDNPV